MAAPKSTVPVVRVMWSVSATDRCEEAHGVVRARIAHVLSSKVQHIARSGRGGYLTAAYRMLNPMAADDTDNQYKEAIMEIRRAYADIPSDIQITNEYTPSGAQCVAVYAPSIWDSAHGKTLWAMREVYCHAYMMKPLTLSVHTPDLLLVAWGRRAVPLVPTEPTIDWRMWMIKQVNEIQARAEDVTTNALLVVDAMTAARPFMTSTEIDAIVECAKAKWKQQVKFNN